MQTYSLRVPIPKAVISTFEEILVECGYKATKGFSTNRLLEILSNSNILVSSHVGGCRVKEITLGDFNNPELFTLAEVLDGIEEPIMTRIKGWSDLLEMQDYLKVTDGMPEKTQKFWIMIGHAIVILVTCDYVLTTVGLYHKLSPEAGLYPNTNETTVQGPQVEKTKTANEPNIKRSSVPDKLVLKGGRVSVTETFGGWDPRDIINKYLETFKLTLLTIDALGVKFKGPSGHDWAIHYGEVTRNINDIQNPFKITNFIKVRYVGNFGVSLDELGDISYTDAATVLTALSFISFYKSFELEYHQYTNWTELKEHAL